MDRRQVRLRVSGRVQGVCYRAETRDKALDLGINGWVRNLPDGKVEILAQGLPDRIEELVSWCWKGPRWARVDNVEMEWQDISSELQTFRISY